MSDVGSRDWQSGVISPLKSSSFNAAVGTTVDLLHVTGGGIVLWNVDAIPDQGETGVVLVSASGPVYFYCVSQGTMSGHWSSSRGMYVSPGEDIVATVRASLASTVAVSFLYDQL